MTCDWSCDDGDVSTASTHQSRLVDYRKTTTAELDSGSPKQRSPTARRGSLLGARTPSELVASRKRRFHMKDDLTNKESGHSRQGQSEESIIYFRIRRHWRLGAYRKRDDDDDEEELEDEYEETEDEASERMEVMDDSQSEGSDDDSAELRNYITLGKPQSGGIHSNLCLGKTHRQPKRPSLGSQKSASDYSESLTASLTASLSTNLSSEFMLLTPKTNKSNSLSLNDARFSCSSRSSRSSSKSSASSQKKGKVIGLKSNINLDDFFRTEKKKHKRDGSKNFSGLSDHTPRTSVSSRRSSRKSAYDRSTVKSPQKSSSLASSQLIPSTRGKGSVLSPGSSEAASSLGRGVLRAFSSGDGGNQILKEMHRSLLYAQSNETGDSERDEESTEDGTALMYIQKELRTGLRKEVVRTKSQEPPVTTRALNPKRWQSDTSSQNALQKMRQANEKREETGVCTGPATEKDNLQAVKDPNIEIDSEQEPVRSPPIRNRKLGETRRPAESTKDSRVTTPTMDAVEKNKVEPASTPATEQPAEDTSKEIPLPALMAENVEEVVDIAQAPDVENLLDISSPKESVREARRASFSPLARSPPFLDSVFKSPTKRSSLKRSVSAQVPHTTKTSPFAKMLPKAWRAKSPGPSPLCRSFAAKPKKIPPSVAPLDKERRVPPRSRSAPLSPPPRGKARVGLLLSNFRPDIPKHFTCANVLVRHQNRINQSCEGAPDCHSPGLLKDSKTSNERFEI